MDLPENFISSTHNFWFEKTLPFSKINFKYKKRKDFYYGNKSILNLNLT